MSARKYTTLSFTPSTQLYVCEDCSAVVQDTEQHQDWHERLVDILKAIVGAG